MNKKHWWKMGTIATNASPEEIRSKVALTHRDLVFQLSAGHNLRGDTTLPIHYHVEFDMEVYPNRGAAEQAWARFSQMIVRSWPTGSEKMVSIAHGE